MQEGTEQTLVLIKPDAMKNSLTGYVLSLLSEFHTGLRFAGTKVVQVTTMLAAATLLIVAVRTPVDSTTLQLAV